MLEDIDIAPALPSPMFIEAEAPRFVPISPLIKCTSLPMHTSDFANDISMSPNDTSMSPNDLSMSPTDPVVSVDTPASNNSLSHSQDVSSACNALTDRRHAPSLNISISPRPIFKIVPLLDSNEPIEECLPVPLEKEQDNDYFISEGLPVQPSLLARLSDPNQHRDNETKSPTSAARETYPLPPKPIGRRFLLENNLLVLGNHFLGNTFHISPRSSKIDNVLAQCSNASVAVSRLINHEQGYYRPEHVTPVLPASVCAKIDDLTAQIESTKSPLRRNHIKRERDQLRDLANWEYFLGHNDFDTVD
ncbi:hypothetical protein CPC08DRAFT_771664 [Agrocybe pediades]|nr:hypothetical protein CPC08DRAFT_771664 [Agrocybe pediades]